MATPITKSKAGGTPAKAQISDAELSAALRATGTVAVVSGVAVNVSVPLCQLAADRIDEAAELRLKLGKQRSRVHNYRARIRSLNTTCETYESRIAALAREIETLRGQTK